MFFSLHCAIFCVDHDTQMETKRSRSRSTFRTNFETNTGQTELLTKTCFGCPIATVEKDKQWFELSLEEACYLSTIMKCIHVVGEDKCIKTDEVLLRYAMSKNVDFLNLFKGYSHLRSKNWVVVKGGSQSRYSVDFVAYRHHPSLVHSEYAVIVLSGEDENRNARLRVWSDLYSSLRVCGSVAKTLLVLYVSKNGDADAYPSCLEHFVVEERIITRWNPEQSRENQKNDDDFTIS